MPPIRMLNPRSGEPVSDARAVGDELKRLGYTVDVGENPKKTAMQQALDRFYAKIKGDTTAVIFFSGFGIQVDRQYSFQWTLKSGTRQTSSATGSASTRSSAK